MKISDLWLKEWVNPSLTAQELAAQLTMAGLEVDEIAPVAGEFSNVVVAEILETKPHPQADKLTLCAVNAGEASPISIVCGASNVRPGLKVALATIGAQLPGNIKIKKAKLRGEVSFGMLCSASELGLAEQSEGIMELDEGAPIGADLRTYLQLNDWVLDIDLTPNRADCFSVKGIARETAALNQLPFTSPPLKEIEPEIDDSVSVSIEESSGCPIYRGRIIRGINPEADTPAWMVERLRRSGIRPLHPVVDVTNYVMLELGQPMHAFDLQALHGGIIVRNSQDEERLDLLDGQSVQLQKGDLVIADNEKALAIAGVMGGETSSVHEATTDIFLESAFFNPFKISGVARRYGLCTDSSQRFERGVDYQLSQAAIERATELLLSIVGGKPGPVVSEIKEKQLPKTPKIKFHLSSVKRLTGVDVSYENISTLLTAIGMKLTEEENDVFQVEIPSHRFDIHIEADLVEEVIRLYGYDKIQTQPARYIMKPGKLNERETLSRELTRWFRTRGYHETINYSFVDPEVQACLYDKKDVLTLLNPISSELSQMRLGLWPGLIASMMYNIHRQCNEMRLFEQGVVFHKNDSVIHEEPMIAGLLTGEHGTLNWSETDRCYDFYDMKGDVEALLSELKLNEVQFKAEPHPALHPGKCAQILIKNQPAGWLGTLHPQITDMLDIEQDVFVFELSVSALINSTVPKYQGISKYPQVRRDLSFLIAEEIQVDEVKKAVTDTITQSWLKRFDVFDVYHGKGIPEGKKSIGVSLTLQDQNQTLTDNEINDLISAILKSLEDKFAITLRD